MLRECMLRKRAGSKKRKWEAGFTLVELLVVIAVLGVLAGIMVPQYLGVRDRAIEAATEAELQAVRMTWQYYNIEQPHGKALEDLVDADPVDQLEALERYLGEELNATTGAYSPGGGDVTYTLAWVSAESHFTATPAAGTADRVSATITRTQISISD